MRHRSLVLGIFLFTIPVSAFAQMTVKRFPDAGSSFSFPQPVINAKEFSQWYAKSRFSELQLPNGFKLNVMGWCRGMTDSNDKVQCSRQIALLVKDAMIKEGFSANRIMITAMPKETDEGPPENYVTFGLAMESRDAHPAQPATPLPPFFAAISRGEISRVRKMLDEGTDVNLLNHGRTPLMQPAVDRRSSIARLLIERGANIDLKFENFTALTFAVWNCDGSDIADMLIEKGADVRVLNASRDTTLMIASHRSCASLAQTLIKKGVDVNARNKFGLTALMMTTDEETATVLLRNGADINARDDKGGTALSNARKHKNQKMVRFLEKAGAKPDLDQAALPNKVETHSESAHWGPDEGMMGWQEGKDLCSSKGMRLPSRDELSQARGSGFAASWAARMYWTGELTKPGGQAYLVDVRDGRIVDPTPLQFMAPNVRCRR